MASDPLLDASAPARHLAAELVLAIERIADRRRARWPAALVAAPLEDALRLHQALDASLRRICTALSPELLQAAGLAEPPRPAPQGEVALDGEGSASQ